MQLRNYVDRRMNDDGGFYEVFLDGVVDLATGTVPSKTLIGVLLSYQSLKLALHAANFHLPLGESVGHLGDGFNKPVGLIFNIQERLLLPDVRRSRKVSVGKRRPGRPTLTMSSSG